MAKVFVDTYCWFCLLSIREKDHERAQLLLDGFISAGTVIVTTEEVLVELFSILCRAGAGQRKRALELLEWVMQDDRFRVLNQSHDSFREGIELFEKRLDKGYSLVDCISMQAVRRQGIDVVLTADRHFEQEGFRLLF